jgi:hypothetical protein
MERSSIEWLEKQTRTQEWHSLKREDIIEKAKEIEKEKEKSDFIGGYLTCAMKDHNLPYGKEYLNLLSDKEIEAEAKYKETFKL